MTTGQELGKIFENKIDKPYSQYINPTQQNRLLKEAFFTAIENKDKVLDEQKVYDEIKLNIVTGAVYVPTSNQVYTSDLQVTAVTSSGFVVTVTTGLPHNLIIGDTFTLSGVSGITNVNGSFTVTAIPTSFKFTYVATSLPTGSYTSGGQLTTPKIISDYMHLSTVKSKFTKQYYDLNVTAATNATPIVLTLDNLNNLRSTEQITISGVLGNTNSNGTYYIKRISSKKIALYSDKNLTTAVSGNGVYTSGGIISRIFYEYNTYYFSDRKISSYSNPTIDDPRVELSKNLLKFHPLDEVCQEITIDYISTATVLPDVNNATVDLELYYPFKFLVYVCDVAASIFAGEARDIQLQQSSQVSLEQNK